MMGRIPILLSIVCLATLTQGQQTPAPPMITNFLTRDFLAPEDVKFRTDNAMKLPCAASGNNLKWTWKHNETEITEQQLQFGNRFKVGSDGTLTGSNLGTSQSGNYQCFVKDTVTNVEIFSRKIKVAVTVVGTFITRTNTEVKVDLGEELSIDCPSHNPSFGVSYSWTGKVGDTDIQFKRNDRRAISQTGQLFIIFVTQEDFDEVAEFQNQGIECTISAANSYQRSGLVKITKRTPGKTDPGTKRAPAWRKIPGVEETAIEGRNKTLYCLAVGRPVPSITWKKLQGGKWTNLMHGQGSYEIAIQARLLNIMSVQRDLHQARYRCEALNSESNGIPLVHETNLKVEVPPKWIQASPSELSIDINGNGSLTCDVSADPVPSFTWYKNGIKLLTSTTWVKIDNNKLKFETVRYPQEAGVYQCVAENSHGMIVSSTWIKVLAIAPSFENGFGPFYLFRDSQGRLKCNPKATPPPKIFKWYKEGQELKGSRYSVEADGTLVINTVTEGDKGTYECYAENFLGNDREKAGATIYEPTIILIAPSDRKVDKGSRVDLRCEASADDDLELKYLWKRDNAMITYNNKIQWLEGAKVLTIADITIDDAGIYTCCAYTPDPKRSEDCESATVDIAGVPNPPTIKSLTDCFNRTTTLEWIPGAANNASITNFWIEQESDYEPYLFRVISNVENSYATSVSLNLTGWATLRFRVRAANCFGSSRASLTTASKCITKVGIPDKYPDDLRGAPKKADQLDIAWTAMPKIDWNAPGFYYILVYRSLPNGQNVTEKIRDPTVNVFAIPNPGYYKPWEFRIQVGNIEGLGPMSPLVQSYSGQDPPADKPEDLKAGAVTAHTVELTWKPVTVTHGSVDGYRIYYWGESRLTARRRRVISVYAKSVDVLGGNTQKHAVTGLTPYTNYNMVIKAFNSGGEGPASSEIFAPTYEAEPGPPSDVRVYAFAKYILVTWKAPLKPNGIITKYRVGSKEFPGSQPADNLVVDMQEVSASVCRKLFGDQTPGKNHVVQIQAQTSIGWGKKISKTSRTVKYAAPAKPKRPTVEGIAVDKVKVTYNFGLVGGYTHEFLVMYRKKLEGEKFVNTSWVNHFQTESSEIGDLSPELYEFKTVGRNDYRDDNDDSTKTESPPSDVTEGRPLPGVVCSSCGDKNNTLHAIYMVVIILLLITNIFLILFVCSMRRRLEHSQRSKKCPRCGDLIALDNIAVEVDADTQSVSSMRTDEAPSHAAPVDHMPPDPSIRSWEVSREQNTIAGQVDADTQLVSSTHLVEAPSHATPNTITVQVHADTQPVCSEQAVDAPSLAIPNIITVHVDAGTQLVSSEQTADDPSHATAVTGDYMPLNPSTISWEVSREQVNIIKVIGKGAFSQVAQATVRNIRGSQENTTVAVKMLKAKASDSDRKDLLSELELIKKLKPHPHVIKLVGCVTESDPPLVLIEYVPFGDLLGYLRKSRGLNDTYFEDPDVKPQSSLTAEQLMKFAWQVADGMSYLSAKKIIHRDFAARNVLVGEGEKCKVTDFGMARNVQQDDIYNRKSPGRLPVKWTAYEALMYGTYTTQSDVWSYGILLYEILTVGGSPYPDVNAREIPRKLQEGYRMPKPRHVKDQLYQIMLRCWEENPLDRPTFQTLRETIKEMEGNYQTYVNWNQYDHSLYAS